MLKFLVSTRNCAAEKHCRVRVTSKYQEVPVPRIFVSLVAPLEFLSMFLVLAKDLMLLFYNRAQGQVLHVLYYFIPGIYQTA